MKQATHIVCLGQIVDAAATPRHLAAHRPGHDVPGRDRYALADARSEHGHVHIVLVAFRRKTRLSLLVRVALKRLPPHHAVYELLDAEHVAASL